MALTDKKQFRIEVTENDHIQIRQARIIMDDGVEISRQYIRFVVAPGDDVSGFDGRIRRAVAAIHVPTVVALHKAKSDKADRKTDRDMRGAEHRRDQTAESEAAEAKAEQALLDAEAELEAAEAAHEAFLASEDA